MSTDVPTEHKVLILPAAHSDFVVQKIPVPKPGPGQVLVRADVVGLNPSDAHAQSSGDFVLEWPVIQGWEAAGTVVQLGEGVTSPSLGEKVYVLQVANNSTARLITTRHHFRLLPGEYGGQTTFRQYIVVPADLTSKVREVYRIRLPQ